jgi:hypothetical protein
MITISAAYDEFGIDQTEFAPLASFVGEISRKHVERDFWVRLTSSQLDTLHGTFGMSRRLREALVETATDYLGTTSSYAPLVRIGGSFLSTVTLLSRFGYHWRDRCLAKQRRYQIRAGFIFERAVIDALKAQGFEHTGVKRVNMQEFDVVMRRDGIVWNVQCKNNLTDFSRVENDPAAFARYNRSLVRSYRKAIEKEVARERLLADHLAASRIEHLVVAKFPVVTSNPRIVPFSRIERVGQTAAGLMR